MKPQYSIIPLILLLLISCAAPIKYEDLNTIEDRIGAAQTELKTAVNTVEKLILRGVIQKGTARHSQVKAALSKAEQAIQATITALSLGNVLEAEQNEIIMINALYALREVLANE